MPYVYRYQAGDWGQISDELRDDNEREWHKPAHARKYLQSRYEMSDGERICISANLSLGITCVFLENEFQSSQ